MKQGVVGDNPPSPTWPWTPQNQPHGYESLPAPDLMPVSALLVLLQELIH